MSCPGRSDAYTDTYRRISAPIANQMQRRRSDAAFTAAGLISLLLHSRLSPSAIDGGMIV